MNNTTSNKSKAVPIIGILLVLAAGAYFFFWKGSATPVDSALTKTKAGPGNSSVQEDLLKTLKEVKNLTLDDSVLRSPFFLSSIDFTKVLVREPKFRKNPFAPIGVDGGRSQNTVSTPSLAPLPVATSSVKTR